MSDDTKPLTAKERAGQWLHDHGGERIMLGFFDYLRHQSFTIVTNEEHERLTQRIAELEADLRVMTAMRDERAQITPAECLEDDIYVSGVEAQRDELRSALATLRSEMKRLVGVGEEQATRAMSAEDNLKARELDLIEARSERDMLSLQLDTREFSIESERWARNELSKAVNWLRDFVEYESGNAPPPDWNGMGAFLAKHDKEAP